MAKADTDLFGESSPRDTPKPVKKQKPANVPLAALAGVNMLGRPRPYEAYKDPRDPWTTIIKHSDPEWP